MYAVFQTGGKQYQVKEGDLINIEKIPAEIGDKVKFNEVLLVKAENQPPRIGQPWVESAYIETEVAGQDKEKKVIVYDFRRRHGSHKTQGHRQSYTCIKVTKIHA